jgi:hypothetical protein
LLPPAPPTVGLGQQGTDSDARADGDRLDVLDVAEDFELHTAILG